jgi:hypothetical protein
MAIFIDDRRICIDQLRAFVPATFIDDAAEMHLLELDGKNVHSKLLHVSVLRPVYCRQSR